MTATGGEVPCLGLAAITLVAFRRYKYGTVTCRYTANSDTMDRQTHRFLFFSNDSRSAPHPPTLLKLSSSSSAPLAPSASQSFTEAFTQSAAQILRVRVSATRLVSGQQHYLDQAIDTEDLSQCARDAQKSQRLTIDEAVGLLFEAIEKRDYEATYDKHSKKCKASHSSRLTRKVRHLTNSNLFRSASKTWATSDWSLISRKQSTIVSLQLSA